ncbi:GNAT family N-acetyltransferase [Fructobacillus sp. M1-13]|uniref:GNAT family N-acetyltransferase n=1 Tax=Fructobacillus papyriferae TaxID=2713171 RepID=A0ABS5QQS8_9LACO|nr:GNAT family N-acetyltransferase [Fructobacillus papyriferae]MBS9335471.1 GNAT family N-acetyltransferase [Fructobacillus papyriferae]MCD2159241.1 GNAT family N-acetyltransferase [Fructobacillus papyriferae]
MTDVQIKKVGLSDLAKLVAISRATFAETFAADNSEADLAAFLDQHYAPEKLRAEIELAGSDFYFCLVAEKVVGYLKLNRDEAQSEPLGSDALEIERIYFLSDYQGQGLGSRFFSLAEEIAFSTRKSWIWLGVWEHNDLALAVYQKKGFVPFSDHVFQVGDDRQRDILMKKVL